MPGLRKVGPVKEQGKHVWPSLCIFHGTGPVTQAVRDRPSWIPLSKLVRGHLSRSSVLWRQKLMKHCGQANKKIAGIEMACHIACKVV